MCLCVYVWLAVGLYCVSVCWQYTHVLNERVCCCLLSGCRSKTHSAAVDPEGGSMYMYGGVTLHIKNETRVPAEGEAGLVHAFDFQTYTWSTLHTSGAGACVSDVRSVCVKHPLASAAYRAAFLPHALHMQALHTQTVPAVSLCVCAGHTGDHMPRSTTLLAFFWHAGSLWAVPDLPRVEAASNRKTGKLLAAGYQLLRLDMDSKQWQRVACEVRIFGWLQSVWVSQAQLCWGAEGLCGAGPVCGLAEATGLLRVECSKCVRCTSRFSS